MSEPMEIPDELQHLIEKRVANSDRRQAESNLDSPDVEDSDEKEFENDRRKGQRRKNGDDHPIE